MKIAIIGDLHYGIKGGHPAFFEFQMKYMEYFLNKCVELGVTHVFQLGDVFDNRKYTNNFILYGIVTRFVSMVKESGITWTIVTGNHDLYYRDNNSVSPLVLLNKLEPLLFDVVEENKEKTFGSKKFLFVSWLNKNNSEKQLEAIAKSDANYCLGHFEPANVPMYSNVPVRENGISIDIFSKFTAVLSGHYHTASINKNFIMTSAPIHLTWADVPDGTNRGFFVLDTESDELDFIQNSEDQTLFHIIEYDNEKKYKEDDLRPYFNSILKIIIKSKDNSKNFKDFKNLITQIPLIDYSFEDQTIKEVVHIEIKEESLSLDTMEVFSNFIDKQETQLNKDVLKEIATDVFTRAINYEE